MNDSCYLIFVVVCAHHEIGEHRCIMDKPFDFPEVRNYVDVHHIDGSPDGNYALRILEHYRSLCNTVWVVEGLPENTRLIYDYMNECQQRRAKELDRAIQILRQTIPK